MTGVGRTGRMWACEHENVAPDILCTAKGLTAGYLPLAATIASDDIYNAFLGEYKELKTFFHGHTFTGNQLGCAVALANLKIFEQENLIKKIHSTITHFKRRLQEFYTLEHVGDVRICGLAAGVELVRDKAAKEPYPFDEQMGIQVCNEALRRNVILRPLVNTIVLMPPLQISISELDQLLEVVYASIKEITSVKDN
jgi:adenosylmethionine-8-amino-7-oxononanoate aminotransferase